MTADEIIKQATKTDDNNPYGENIELTIDPDIETWTIQRSVGTWTDRYVFGVTDNVDTIARAISKHFPNEEVSIQAYTRSRRTYLNGEITHDNNRNLSEYYLGITAKQNDAWLRILPIPDED